MVVSPISFAIVNYFLAKYEPREIVKEKLRKFKIISEFCKLDENTIEKGLNSDLPDFENYLQHISAVDSNCKIIITRNEKISKNH